MRHHAALLPRISSRQKVCRILTALILALAAFLVSARPVLADDKSTDKSLTGGWKSILGPVEVHFVFTDVNGKQQDYSLAAAPSDFLQKLTPRLQAESKFPLLWPKGGFFDGLWLQNEAAICKEVVAGTGKEFPPGGNNQAYDITCRPFKFGFLSAYITKANPYFKKYNSMGVEVIPAGGYPTGQVSQLQLEFSSANLNLLRYTLTTPCTCHDKNIFCNKDPDFTAFWDASIYVRANSTQANTMQFGPRPQMQSAGGVQQNTLVLKDGKAIEQQIAGLESTLERQLATDLASLAATGEFSFATVIFQFIEDLFKYGLGGLIEMSCNGQMFHNLSIDPHGWVSYNSPTILRMTKTVNEAFKTLFLALDSASAVGFTKLDIEEGPGKSLIFKLTYPAPGNPGLVNAAAAQNAPQNKAIHLVATAASIGTPTKQVKAGFPVMVLGKQFKDTYINAIDLGWGKTVAGIANTTVQWGPKGGQMKNSPPVIGVTKFHAANLSPSTAYQFRVHECDRIACAPWSEWLTTNTQAGGSNDVTIYLDNNTAEKIGTGTVLPNGSFNIKATIPANTAPGTHTITAATGVGLPQNIAALRGGSTPGSPAKTSTIVKANSQITVIGQGGAGAAAGSGSATISIMNAGTAITPPVPMALRSTFRLRGAGFAPAVVVNVHLDSATGPKVGSATPNKLGIFAANFELPATTSGNHEIVAVQAANQPGIKSLRGRAIQTLQATVQVKVMPPIK